MVFALLTPFAAFWVPESLGGSGVLATVVCGLYVSWNGPRFISPATRLQGFFVWDLVIYLIEGLVFLMTGLQARVVADTLDLSQWKSLALACAVVCAVIIVVRFIWVFMATYLPRLGARPGAARSPAALAGHFHHRLHRHPRRGVAGGGAVHSADGGRRAFPHRGLLLLITFSVILVTLVGQGFTLPWVIRLLGIAEHGRREADTDKKKEISARLASIDAALARLDSLEGAVAAPETVAALRRRNEDRRAYFVAACQDLGTGDISNASAALQLQFLDAERASIADLYYRGEISDEARRRIERELDLEDSRIRHSAECAGRAAPPRAAALLEEPELPSLSQTSILLVRICTTSPFWFLVSLRTVIMPRSGLERDGVTARISLSTCSTSPGRVGRGQVISPPAPISPPAMGMPLFTSSDMVMEAVCQPLAARPWKKLLSASVSLR